MNIFILEDDDERLRFLRERLMRHDVTVAKSCAHEASFVGGYDLVLLDHDLGGRQLEDHEDCGATFCELVAGRIGATPVIVHSYNKDGAARMLKILSELTPATPTVWAPFRGTEFNALLAQLP